MQNIRRIYAVKTVSYILLTVFALALQNALPNIAHVHPQLLILLTALAALFQGPYTGGTVGFFCGLLADWLSAYGVVYYTIILMLAGVVFGLISDRTMRKTLLSAYFISAAVLVVTQFLYFIFFLFMAGRAGFQALLDITVPEILYSLALLPLFYFPARTVYRRTLIKRKG